MTDDDVSGDDMTTHEFSDDEAEAIISGFAPSDPELGAALDDLRSSFAAVEHPTASGELNEFIVRGADPVSATADTAAVPVVDVLVDPTPTRRHPVFASISAFAGTALGKIFIGASVAAAGVGGAAATGIETPIDVIFETPIDAIFNDDAVVETEDDLLGDDSTDVPVIDEPPADEARRDDDLDDVDPATGESDDEDELDDDESDDDKDELDDDELDDESDDDDLDDLDDEDDDLDDDLDDLDDEDDDLDDDLDDLDDEDDDLDDEDDLDDDLDDEDDLDDDLDDEDDFDDDESDDDDLDDEDDHDDLDDEDEDELDDDDTPTTTTPVIDGTASVTHTVQDVGTISFTYDSGSWNLGAVSPADGYVVDEAGIDDEGPDVSFDAGPIEVDVDVEVENGQIRIRVRTENDDTGDRTEAFFFYPIS
jgi:hypothetical protein